MSDPWARRIPTGTAAGSEGEPLSCTRNLTASIKWALPMLRYQPMDISDGEPALSNANIIVQTVLGPPFRWPWNRAMYSFLCVAGVQDYVVSAPKFGFLESAALVEPDTLKPRQISVKMELELDAQFERPAYVATQIDDGQGNITFRLSPCPDKAYAITLTSQCKPRLLTSLASLWAPIPDEMAYVYDTGFLSLSQLLTNDPRFQIFSQRFAAHLIGRQGGLDETEKNIFLQSWLQTTSMLQTSQLSTQQRVAARQS